MKVLVIGGGGREHALVWKLGQSPRVQKIWCAPGNGGISQNAECHALDASDVDAIVRLAERLKPDWTVIGPELPLVRGVADEFTKRGLKLVGPSKKASELEGSKVFAKDFLERHKIPTAGLYGVYDSPGDAYAALCAVDWPVAIKADGLCAGKGVLVTSSPDDATAFIERVMEKRQFGEGGNRLLMEEALEGEELSFIVLTDGEHIVPLAPTRDHKRAFDRNRGPNTGGMGAYSSPDLLSAEAEKRILDTIVRPAIKGLAAEGRTYRGFLYFGLMITPAGPKVLEFNCRLGDPETQAMALRMEFDLAEALAAAIEGTLDRQRPAWRSGASLCVVMASGGYPGQFETGKEIEGLATAERQQDVVVFHAGTRRESGRYYTSSGRVLGVAAKGADLGAAYEACYRAVRQIRFEGGHYRTDIGAVHAAQVRPVGS